MATNKNYVVVYPNSDMGSEIIIHEYDRLDEKMEFRIFPSIRFECFLTLLQNAEFMIGNSSAGIREASIYGIPVIDIGTRQTGRYNETSSNGIIHVEENIAQIVRAVKSKKKYSKLASIWGWK